MIVLCYFKWINFAHNADDMLLDINQQHFLNGLGDKKLNRYELLT